MASAREETDLICQHADRAATALRYFTGRIYNGHGELSDPSLAMSYLQEAATAIREAQAAHDRAQAIGWNKHA